MAAVVGWRFPPLSGGTRQGYTNNDIEAFKGEELIDNLAREICQNSLDAKNKISDEPVRVVFELKQIDSSGYNVFDGYRECIEGCKKYWGSNMDAKLKRFLADADEMLARDSIPVLVAGDYNTAGLSGSRTREFSSPWEALTGTDGISVKNDDTSGGSFGIGKNAPFACSALSMVFYNTYAADEEKAFIGVARLATLLDKNNEETQRVGKYQNNDNEAKKWTPIFSEISDSFRDIFTRKEKGTDVIIVGFSHANGWMKNVCKAVIKNFFVAICEGKLTVDLKEDTQIQRIDASSIGQIVSDLADDKEMKVTSELFKAFTAPDKKEYLSILQENDAEIFIKSESEYQRSIAHFRDTGMLIYVKSRRIFQHYAAVLVVRGTELGELLRATEPARHNRWDYKLITGASEKEKRKKARDALNKIDESILDLLKKQFEVVTEDTVDAAGVGEYIPDDVDGLGGASEGDDILKAKIKIGKIKTVETKPGTITVTGVKEEGAPEKGSVHNTERNPNPMPPKPRPRVVDPENLEGEQKEGAKTGKGTKTVTLPNLSAQRAFPINSSIGLYKIVIKPTETYKNLYVSCSALGEDSKADVLEMETFTYNGSQVTINDGNRAGPIRIEADTVATFFVRFKSKEKMVLNLHITEVSK